MCEKLQFEKVLKDQIGIWQKGNEYKPMKMVVDIVPCECGKLWASADGKGWVQCEKSKLSP